MGIGNYYHKLLFPELIKLENNTKPSFNYLVISLTVIIMKQRENFSWI